MNIGLCRADIIAGMPPLVFKETIYPQIILDYFQFYQLAADQVPHYFGYINSGNFKIAVHVFHQISRPLVFVLHGYLDHCGLLSKLIRFLIGSGYSVALFDLPGHGLSSGERTAIKNFHEYADVFQSVIRTVTAEIKTEYHSVSISTGASTVYEYLRHYPDIFAKIIFLAPLIRSASWHRSKLAYLLLNKILQWLPRVYRKSSSDPVFLKFIRYHDFLQDKRFSIRWVKSLFEWNRQNRLYPVVNRKIGVIQGDRDSVVAWRYNLPFLQQKFKEVDLMMINNGRHQLLNEHPDLLNPIFSRIKEYLT